MAVENGTSYNSSRNELEDNFGETLLDENAGMQTDAELEYEQQVEDDYNVDLNPSPVATTTTDNIVIDPNSPVICETINEFCARHTREELESLVGQVGYLTISDCYFSEPSSTLCMVIEVKEK